MSYSSDWNSSGEAVVSIDPDEFAAAESEAESAADKYTHKFRKPFPYMGKEYVEMNFDWGSLTGADGLNIEAEMQALGNAVVVPALSGGYLIRMAARACAEGVGYDAFELMPLGDSNRIRSEARSFLWA